MYCDNDKGAMIRNNAQVIGILQIIFSLYGLFTGILFCALSKTIAAGFTSLFNLIYADYVNYADIYISMENLMAAAFIFSGVISILIATASIISGAFLVQSKKPAFSIERIKKLLIAALVLSVFGGGGLAVLIYSAVILSMGRNER